MNCEEEQANELEALQSIYPEELRIHEDQKGLELDILWDADAVFQLPFVQNVSWEGLCLTLRVRYTPNYPEELPELSFVDPFDGLTDSDLDRLLENCEDFAQDLVGMAMIFSLVEHIKEQLLSILSERITREKNELERELLAQEEDERLRSAGTKVTRESFADWQRKFGEEILCLKKSGGTLSPAMQAFAAVAKLFEEKSSTKLTGRQLFEKDTSLATADVAFLDENDVDVDYSLFEGIEDLELEDEENQVLAGGLSDED